DEPDDLSVRGQSPCSGRCPGFLRANWFPSSLTAKCADWAPCPLVSESESRRLKSSVESNEARSCRLCAACRNESADAAGQRCNGAAQIGRRHIATFDRGSLSKTSSSSVATASITIEFWSRRRFDDFESAATTCWTKESG